MYNNKMLTNTHVDGTFYNLLLFMQAWYKVLARANGLGSVGDIGSSRRLLICSCSWSVMMEKVFTDVLSSGIRVFFTNAPQAKS